MVMKWISLNTPTKLNIQVKKNSVVVVEEYAYLVPYVEVDEEIFLKTIITE